MSRSLPARMSKVDQPLSRRRFLAGAGVTAGGLVALGLSGCGDDDDTSGTDNTAATAAATAVPDKPVRGGTFKSAGFSGFGVLDPHVVVGTGANVIQRVYSYLFRSTIGFGREGLTYDLATKHQVEGDQLTWVFTLRPDARISPNSQGIPERALDSEDVKLNFERVADPKTAGTGFAFSKDWIAKVDAPDKATFRIVTKAPYAWTEAQVGFAFNYPIVPKEWLAHTNFKTTAVGSGPFTIGELKENTLAQLRRNSNYYDKDRPYLDEYDVAIFSDQATLRTAFLANQLDVYAATNPDEAKELLSRDKNYQVVSSPSNYFYSFHYNVRFKPWENPLARRAVNRAINRQEYIQLIGKGVGEPVAVVSHAYKDYALPRAEVEKLQPFDIKEATQLFQAAGVTNFTFDYPTSSLYPDYVSIFIRQMKAAGVTAEGTPLDQQAWLKKFSDSAVSATFRGAGFNGPEQALQRYGTGGVLGNGRFDSGYSDPDVDAAIKKAQGTVDEQPRIKAYADLQRLVISKDPTEIGFFGTDAAEVLQPNIRGYRLYPAFYGSAFTKDLWLAKA